MITATGASSNVLFTFSNTAATSGVTWMITTATPGTVPSTTGNGQMHMFNGNWHTPYMKFCCKCRVYYCAGCVEHTG